jgi:hypothetical protein
VGVDRWERDHACGRAVEAIVRVGALPEWRALVQVDDGQERQKLASRIQCQTTPWVPPVVVCLALAGCSSPAINSFNVKPLGYCATTRKIHVDWSTSHGDTTLLIEPSDPTPRSVAAAHSMELDPRDMTLTLQVTNGARQVHTPQIVHAVARHPLDGFASLCDPDAGWVTTDPAQFGGGSNAFDPGAHPEVISNRCPSNAPAHATCRRHVQVIHGANTWDLAPDTAISVAAANAPLTGDWTLKGQLLPGERCGEAPDAKLLELNIEIGCTGDGQ